MTMRVGSGSQAVSFLPRICHLSSLMFFSVSAELGLESVHKHVDHDLRVKQLIFSFFPLFHDENGGIRTLLAWPFGVMH